MGEGKIGNEAFSAGQAAQLHNQLGACSSADIRSCGQRRIVAFRYYLDK